jgi:tight adherence protein C
METTSMLRIAFVSLGSSSVLATAYFLAAVPLPPPPRFGRRGAAREHARASSSSFSTFEPLIRFSAGLSTMIAAPGLEETLETELRRADYPLGLTAREYGALCVLSGIGLGGVALSLCLVTGVGPLVAIPALAFGLLLPRIQVQEITRRRVKEITRGLPHAIEIAALCMGAGADFPGALRLLVSSNGSAKTGALTHELSVILEQLELGHTRREALLDFSERVQTPSVRDFVSAVIQAEEKGNPLAKVIQTQGRMLNQRRSVAAEEAAARAGVMMIAPLMLLLVAILVILMGPFLVGSGGL